MIPQDFPVTTTEPVGLEHDHVLAVSNLERIASPSVLNRVKEADVDKDGNISVQELIQLVQSEQRAHADRRLFRNFLIALVVAVLFLVAAMVGTVYGIVKLTDEVNDSNDVLVSANTGNVMATGKATSLMDLSQLYGVNNSTDSADGAMISVPDVSLAEQLEVLVVPQSDGGFEVHRVASVRSFPTEQRAIIVSQDGSIIQVGTTGIIYLKDAIADFLAISEGAGDDNAASGRRLLSRASSYGIHTGYGVGTRTPPPVAPSSCRYTEEEKRAWYQDCLRNSCDPGLLDLGPYSISCEDQCERKLIYFLIIFC